jgi:uncharacterized membrane protein YebE (DUF533 family)
MDEMPDPEAMPGYDGLIAHAMISAAAASGEIDPEQKLHIARQVMKAGIETGYDPRFVAAMERPWTPRKLADHCSSEHERLAVYQAAVALARPDCVAAAGFLEALYIVLGITRVQRASFHRARRP